MKSTFLAILIPFATLAIFIPFCFALQSYNISTIYTRICCIFLFFVNCTLQKHRTKVSIRAMFYFFISDYYRLRAILIQKIDIRKYVCRFFWKLCSKLEHFGFLLRCLVLEVVIRHAGRVEQHHLTCGANQYHFRCRAIIYLFHNLVLSLIRSFIHSLFHHLSVDRINLIAANDEYLVIDKHFPRLTVSIYDCLIDAGNNSRSLACAQTQAIFFMHA